MSPLWLCGHGRGIWTNDGHCICQCCRDLDSLTDISRESDPPRPLMGAFSKRFPLNMAIFTLDRTCQTLPLPALVLEQLNFTALL